MKSALIVFVAYITTAVTTEMPGDKTVHEINAPYCQHARDEAFQKYDFTSDFELPENKKIISHLANFKATDCYQNPSIPEIDKQLLKKQAKSIITALEKK